jgi:hypothetical protein
MGTPYRASLLTMLHPECTFIDSAVTEIESDIAAVRDKLIKRSRLNIYWLGILSSLVIITFLVLSTSPSTAALVAAFFPIPAAHFVARSPKGLLMTSRISHWPGFRKYHKRIEALHGKIADLYEPAKRYQAQLEPEGFPGLLAVYSDVLGLPDFPCEVARDKRLTSISYSQKGEGQKISIRVYGQLLQSLKLFDFEAFLSTKPTPGVDTLQALTRSSVALQCSYLISMHIAHQAHRLEPSVIGQLKIIGLNAWHLSNNSKLSTQWTHTQNNLFDSAGRVFTAFEESPKARMESAENYLNLVARVKLNNQHLAEQVFAVA